MKPLFRSVLAAALLAVASHAPLANAGLFDDDEARRAILDIRNKIDSLQRDVNSRLDNKADKTSSLGLADQNEQLRQEMAKLRGQIEVLTNELANTQQRQKDFYVDLDARLRKLEPQQVTVDGKEVSVDPNEQKTYDAALAQFKAGDYRGAGAAFSDFIRRYPQSGFLPSAQYWLGNAYYAQRDYQECDQRATDRREKLSRQSEGFRCLAQHRQLLYRVEGQAGGEKDAGNPDRAISQCAGGSDREGTAGGAAIIRHALPRFKKKPPSHLTDHA